MSDQQEDRRLKTVDQHTKKLNKSIEGLRNEKKSIEQQVVNREISPLALIAKEREIETKIVEHDSTGAKQVALLEGHMQKMLDERGWDQNEENGHLSVTDTDNSRYFGMVALSELDRLNVEGGHKTGNAGLGLTVDAIEQAIQQAVEGKDLPRDPEDLYEIFHRRGADFVFTLNLEGLSPELQTQITTTLKRTLESFKTAQEGPVEGSPVAFSMMKQADAVSLFNDFQDRLDPDQREVLTEKRQQEVFTDLLRRSSQYSLEERILWAKGTRFIDLLESGDPDAENFYQQYVEKLFDGTNMPTLDDFRMDDNSGGDKAEQKNLLLKKLRETIAGKITKMLAWERQAVTAEEQVLLDVLSKNNLKEQAVGGISDEDMQVVKSTEVKAEKLAQHRSSTRRNKEVHDYNHSVVEVTKIISRLKTEPQNITPEDIELLDALIEQTAIPQTVAIEGSEINVLDRLNEARAHLTGGAISDGDIAELEMFLAIAQQERDSLLSRIDRQSGLPNRGEYYLSLEDKIKEKRTKLSATENLPPDYDVRTIFIDLGFLKYFASAGGEDVVSFALKSTGEVLDGACISANVDGEAFRYAGDEFTILFTGTKEDERRLLAALEKEKKSKGKIPNSERSNPLYRPEPLEINYGSSSSSMAEEAMEALAGKGVPGNEQGEDYDFQLAEIQTRLADAAIESQKGLSRFILLMEKMREDFPDGIPSEKSLSQRQTELIVKYSQKALFGLDIKKLHEMAIDPAYDYGTPEGLRNLQDYIKSKKQTSDEILPSINQLEDEVILSYVREEALRREIVKYEIQLAELQVSFDQATEKIQRIERERTEKADEDARRKMTEIQQQLLAEQQTHELKINAGRKHITTLHAEKQEIAARRDRLKTTEQPNSQ